ncbi:hypothetical protein AGOR_G00004840 [Albula goreensis]|uniref:Cell cycle progression protein 1 n=1 Tax=Albula goreensis TaxID=1534307 RepID=A0A8T3E4K6_9TELE|nr:hypothetical protein AGOR_G00004840 [Albula goreensis]
MRKSWMTGDAVHKSRLVVGQAKGGGKMSESSSDTESSCGWTIISNEGSDIETLGPENGADSKPELSEGLEGEEAQEEEEVQKDVHQESSVLQAECSESSLDSTLKEETLKEVEAVSEAVEEHVTCSLSEHSDIMILEPSTAAEPGALWEEQQGVVQEELLGREELYMGTSISSQYTFSASETTPTLPMEPPARDSSSSSSGDEEVQEPTLALRRRRVRRTTATASEAEETKSPGQDGQEQPEQEEQPEQDAPPSPGRSSGTLNKCILLALVIAVSMGFGHFYGTVQILERQKPSHVGADLLQCQRERDVIAESKMVVQNLKEDLEEKQAVVLLLAKKMDKMTKENHQLRLKQSQLQVQKEELTLRLKQSAHERNEMESHHRHLSKENQQLKNSLEHEEESLSTLQEELLNLRTQIRDLEERSAGADSVLSENQKLKENLEEEKQRIRGFLGQKEALVAEAQMLRWELDKEQRVTDQLREELEQLSSQSTVSEGEADPETEELQARLAELEKKLNFEQQRSDLWERLYVETKEERAKGDQQPRPRKPKDGIINKVKETFDAVKNSTKEFVHHHKEQIKKAKEAVKENLRKFSDSVKSTFRHFKDSASHVFEKARGPQERNSMKGRRLKENVMSIHRSIQESTSRRTLIALPGSPSPRSPCISTHANPLLTPFRLTESMSLFNKALEPIQADEFNQLIHRYLKQKVEHFHHWGELESFVNNFFHNGVFIHDQMLFTDFVSGVEDYLEDMDEYQRYDKDVFENLDDYVYKHFFGDSYLKRYGPSRPIEKPAAKRKQNKQDQHQWQHHQAHPRPQKERKWSRPGRSSGRHMANVKIELGPMPFDPKY